MLRTERRIVVGLSIIFFVSGFAALLYQVVWQRMLGLLSGSDVRSVTIVTSAFLGGLGMGSWLGGRLADRLDSTGAIRAYGLCNLGIAAFAVISKWLFYDVLFRQVGELTTSDTLALVIAFASLLCPTVLMGLSLPLLARAIVKTMTVAAHRISILYGINTLGAAVGALLTGWLLVGTFGMDWTLMIGAALSLAAGGSALWLSRGQNDVARSFEGPVMAPRPEPMSSAIWLWCALVFIAGFMSVSLEIIWFRVLDVTLKSNAYTFAFVLFVYLLGDGVGSLIGARAIRFIRRPRAVFLAFQVAIATCALVSVYLLAWLAERSAFLHSYVTQYDGLSLFVHAPLAVVGLYFMASMVLMGLPVLLGGFNFPISQLAVQRSFGTVGRHVGMIKVANISGNTVGSIVTGLIVLQAWGTNGALRIIGLLGLVFCLAVVVEQSRTLKSISLGPVLVAVGLSVVWLIYPDNTWLWSRLHGQQSDEAFFLAEDSTGVAAIRQPPDRPSTLFANGQGQSRAPFTLQHIVLGVLPALVHPAPEQVFVIGIASGGTPYAAGINPATRRVVAVEIVGAELDLLKVYAQQPFAGSAIVQRLLADSRYEFVIGDGRRELIRTDQRFDIIEADAIPPVASHSGMLYSFEYFESARARLADGGLMTQWRATPRVERTFRQVFPYGANIGNFVLLGSNAPVDFDRQAVLARLQAPGLSRYLTGATVEGIEAVRKWISEASIDLWTPDTARDVLDVNTDLLPKDEFYLNNLP